MKTITTLLILLLLPFTGFTQDIYKGFNTEMDEEAAIQEFRDNRKQYKNIELGGGYDYKLKRNNLIMNKGKLIAVRLIAKPNTLPHSVTVDYLNFTKDFLERKGYTIYSKPEYWNAPHHFSSDFGLLMESPDQEVMIQLYPVKFKGVRSFTVHFEVWNNDYLKTYFENETKERQKVEEESGF